MSIKVNTVNFTLRQELYERLRAVAKQCQSISIIDDQLSSYWKKHQTYSHIDFEDDSCTVHLSGSSGLNWPMRSYSNDSRERCEFIQRNVIDRLERWYPTLRADRPLLERLKTTCYPEHFPFGYSIKGIKTSFDLQRSILHVASIQEGLIKERTSISSVLEIGPGTGILCYCLLSVLDSIDTYTVIDLPRVLMYFASFQLKILDSLEKRNPSNFPFIDKFNDIRLTTPNAIEQLSGDFNLFINTDSFQEMNYETIRTYFALMRSKGAKGCLLYTSNRERKKLPGGEVLNFNHYPWAPNDRFIFRRKCNINNPEALTKSWPLRLANRLKAVPLIRASKDTTHIHALVALSK